MPQILGKRVLILLFITLHSVLSMSGCERCATTNDCSQAFHSGPGQFCGDFQAYGTTKPCCCPNNSQCQLSYGQCNCFVPNNRSSHSNGGYGTRGYNNHRYNNDDYYDEDGAGFLAFVIIVIILCWCCGCCKSGQPQDVTGEYVPIAVPINSNGNNDGAGNPPPTAPNYQSTSSFNWNYGRSRNTSDQGFAWGPALGGFVFGEVLGSMSSGGREGRHHHRHHHRHHSGGGGFTIGGDTGGGGGFGGGTTIRGDS